MTLEPRGDRCQALIFESEFTLGCGGGHSSGNQGDRNGDDMQCKITPGFGETLAECLGGVFSMTGSMGVLAAAAANIGSVVTPSPVGLEVIDPRQRRTGPITQSALSRSEPIRLTHRSIRDVLMDRAT